MCVCERNYLIPFLYLFWLLFIYHSLIIGVGGGRSVDIKVNSTPRRIRQYLHPSPTTTMNHTSTRLRCSILSLPRNDNSSAPSPSSSSPCRGRLKEIDGSSGLELAWTRHSNFHEFRVQREAVISRHTIAERLMVIDTTSGSHRLEVPKGGSDDHLFYIPCEEEEICGAEMLGTMGRRALKVGERPQPHPDLPLLLVTASPKDPHASLYAICFDQPDFNIAASLCLSMMEISAAPALISTDRHWMTMAVPSHLSSFPSSSTSSSSPSSSFPRSPPCPPSFRVLLLPLPRPHQYSRPSRLSALEAKARAREAIRMRLARFTADPQFREYCAMVEEELQVLQQVAPPPPPATARWGDAAAAAEGGGGGRRRSSQTTGGGRRVTGEEEEEGKERETKRRKKMGIMVEER